jgi:hypothetical protein
MTARDRLLKELEQTPDILIEEILDFCLFLRQRQQTKSSQQLSPSQILDAIADLPLEGQADAFSGQDHDQILYAK